MIYITNEQLMDIIKHAKRMDYNVCIYADGRVEVIKEDDEIVDEFYWRDE